MLSLGDDLVDWRLANGSMCHVCPLNGQRKVGCDGDPNAAVVLIGEAPGAEEESYNAARQKYGRPFVGRSGWSLKVRLLAPAGLAEVTTPEEGWPQVKKLNAFVLNTIMCRPPKNRIDSPVGRKAVACCSRSAIALLQALQQQRSERCLVPLGGTALELLTGESAISPYRGRVLQVDPAALIPLTEAEVYSRALRGLKPPTEFAPHLVVIKSLLAWNRRQLRKRSKPMKVSVPTEALPHLGIVSAVVARQRRAMTAGARAAIVAVTG